MIYATDDRIAEVPKIEKWTAFFVDVLQLTDWDIELSVAKLDAGRGAQTTTDLATHKAKIEISRKPDYQLHHHYVEELILHELLHVFLSPITVEVPEHVGSPEEERIIERLVPIVARGLRP